MFFKSVTAGMVATCALMGAAAEANAPAKPAFMPIGEAADAPSGFTTMCTRDASLCALGGPIKAVSSLPAPMGAPDVETDCQTFRFGFTLAGCATNALESWTSPADGNSPLRLDKASFWPAVSAAASPAVERMEDGAASLPDKTTEASEPVQRASYSAAKLARLVKKVNSDVNRSLIGTTDQAQFGADDVWFRPGLRRGASGDCEDYAIEKRARLEAAGFPADRLFYAVAFVPGNGLHTVLVARLDDGDQVLDNLSARTRNWSKLRYVWLRAQSPGRPLEWNRIGPVAPRTQFAAAW